MDRAEAIGALNFYRNRFYSAPLGTKERDLAEAINVVLPEYCALREQETVTNRNGLEWISVKERLPEDMGDVLVVAFWHERWQTMYGWCRKADGEWFVYTSHGERTIGAVTHWMPLPEPPKEGVEE